MGTSSLSVAVVVSLGIAPQAPGGTAVVEPMVTVEGADVEQRARLDDALARFDSAGLRLADFEIVFSDDESVCAGHLGGFRDRDDTPHVSVLATSSSSSCTSSLTSGSMPIWARLHVTSTCELVGWPPGRTTACRGHSEASRMPPSSSSRTFATSPRARWRQRHGQIGSPRSSCSQACPRRCGHADPVSL